ncbi:MAG: DUF4384 domain-containing protein [Thauera phenolivorans]|uniref:DUF4384 domain-containing protein n=1 Tax=Thauera phenolivorans TaxID=1792543 RepID=A0A7X7R806_9RHOO|nr:DUF4384 domain-containing protein [Thauera phenolivorans]
MSPLMKKSLTAVLCALSLAAPPVLAEAPPAPEPKLAPFVWAAVSAAGQMAFPAFLNWITDGRGGVPVEGQPQLAATDGPAIAPHSFQPFGEVRAEMRPGAAFLTALGNVLANAAIGTPEPVSNQVILGQPEIPLALGEDGRANYQGMHLALAQADRAGHGLHYRAVGAGFETGERFKLRLLSTFDAVVVIDSVNPAGVRRRLYPAASGGDEVVVLKAGQPALIPLAQEQYFEFAGQTGEERLLVTVRDPRARGQALTDQPIYRQDTEWGSNFLQLVPQDSFAGFTQALHLNHVAARH